MKKLEIRNVGGIKSFRAECMELIPSYHGCISIHKKEGKREFSFVPEMLFYLIKTKDGEEIEFVKRKKKPFLIVSKTIFKKEEIFSSIHNTQYLSINAIWKDAPSSTWDPSRDKLPKDILKIYI